MANELKKEGIETDKAAALVRCDERRRHPRSKVEASAVVLAADRYIGCFLVENLSASGALLIGAPRLETGAHLRLLLHLPGNKPLVFSAQVVRQQVNESLEHEFAVAFQQISPQTEDTIQRVVLAALERSPDVLPPTILVLDDSLKVCHALERDLQKLGRRAVSACGPQVAVARLAEYSFELALVDLHLNQGDGDGLEFATFLAKAYPQVRRVLISGHARQCQLDLAVTSGRVHDVIAKPWSRESLARVLATQIAGSNSGSER